MTPDKCRLARSVLGWTQEDLAVESQLDVSFIKEFERSGECAFVTLAMINFTFEDAGLILEEQFCAVKVDGVDPN